MEAVDCSFNPPGALLYPGTALEAELCRWIPGVSIRRADHYAWELHIVAAIGGGTLVSIRRADHYAWERHVDLGAGHEVHVSIRRADHYAWELYRASGFTLARTNVSIRRADHYAWELLLMRN